MDKGLGRLLLCAGGLGTHFEGLQLMFEFRAGSTVLGKGRLRLQRRQLLAFYESCTGFSAEGR